MKIHTTILILFALAYVKCKYSFPYDGFNVTCDDDCNEDDCSCCVLEACADCSNSNVEGFEWIKPNNDNGWDPNFC